MLRGILVAGSVAALSMGSALADPPSAPSERTVTTFDVTNATSTYPMGINASGVVAGSWRDSGSLDHSFIRAANGTFTSFDAPKVDFDAPKVDKDQFRGTYAQSINTSGVVAGAYNDGKKGVLTGFSRATNGKITSFSAATSPKFDTSVSGLNDSGAIVGSYADKPGGYHGFLRTSDGTITQFDAPGAAIGKAGAGTFPSAIDTSGAIAGTYDDKKHVSHGFLRAAAGTFTSFDDPSAGKKSFQGTRAMAMNDGGAVVGYYVDSGGVCHGFVRAASGTFTTLDAPGALLDANQGTFAGAIDSAGVVAGTYNAQDGTYHSFTRTAGGTYNTFTVDDDSTAVANSGINTSGAVTGDYTDSSNAAHGFIANP